MLRGFALQDVVQAPQSDKKYPTLQGIPLFYIQINPHVSMLCGLSSHNVGQVVCIEAPCRVHVHDPLAGRRRRCRDRHAHLLCDKLGVKSDARRATGAR